MTRTVKDIINSESCYVNYLLRIIDIQCIPETEACPGFILAGSENLFRGEQNKI